MRITIKIDLRNKKKALAFLDFLYEYESANKFMSIELIPNATTIKAIKEAEKGMVTKCKNLEE